MFVAASTECFADDDLETALSRLADLEFTRVEIAVDENSKHLKPSQVMENFDQAVARCRNPFRLTPIAYSLGLTGEGAEYYKQFSACCRLAKATKVVCLIVPSGELGTPFNAEVERLRELVKIASVEGVNVALRTELETMTQDPDTANVLCDHVKGLGLCYDPSHYICSPYSQKNHDNLLKHVFHVRLRDTSKDKLQVRVGQGSVEYGRLMGQLGMVHYDRALCVHIKPMEDVDHLAEMRKMRLLLESLIT